MPEPTNPKKRALMPSTKLRKALRAAGHHLAPVVQVGKEGVTDALLRALDEQLAAHELVKVKVGTESPEDRFEVAERLGAAAGAQVAQVLGRTMLVYRRHPERPKFEPLTAAEGRERDLSLAAERAAAEPPKRARRPRRRPETGAGSRRPAGRAGAGQAGGSRRGGAGGARGGGPRGGTRGRGGPRPR